MDWMYCLPLLIGYCFTYKWNSNFHVNMVASRIPWGIYTCHVLSLCQIKTCHIFNKQFGGYHIASVKYWWNKTLVNQLFRVLVRKIYINYCYFGEFAWVKYWQMTFVSPNLHKVFLCQNFVAYSILSNLIYYRSLFSAILYMHVATYVQLNRKVMLN